MTARPIDVHLDTEEHFLTLSTSQRPIVRVNVEDQTALFSAISLLNGIIGGELNLDEVRRVRDLLQEVVGS
jgi:hypothetical protein